MADQQHPGNAAEPAGAGDTPLTIITPWMPSSTLDAASRFVPADIEKHDRMVALALQVMHSAAPWLVPLFAECDAWLMVRQGGFFWSSARDPQRWHEVPPLSQALTLLPWVEEGEAAH